MTVNMGPQHPSTHGVLRLVLELSGETVVSADTTVGYLHTGIEKTAEQKKWQQVIPLVERMDYLGAQSNSLAFCLSVERLLDVKMPERVQNIRVLIAELQRLASHLVWLATHALEIGAVSVMMYCFREREQLLNVNEMLAGFRMFPSYIRIGGLREDLPNGFHQAVKKWLDAFPSKLSEYEDLLTKNQIWLKRTQDGRRHHQGRRDDLRAGRPDGARRRHPLRRPQGVSVSRLRDLRLRRADADRPATSTRATWCASPRCARARKIAQQALARITPRGVFDIQDYKIVPPPKDKVYSEMEALIQHFLIYSQGFNVPAGESLRADRGAARRARVQHRLGRHQPALSHQAARAVVLRVPGAAEDAHRRHDRRRHRRDRLDRRRHGRRGSMSFHPLMVYDQRFQKSERKIADEGPAFTFTPERRAALDDMLTKYPPDQKRSAVLGALYLVQEQQGYLTANGMRHVAGILDMTPAEVEDVATYYVMFYREPVGKYVLQVCRTLSCALMGAERVTEALSEKLGSEGRRDRRVGPLHADGVRVPRRLRPRADRHGEQRALAREGAARGCREAGGRDQGEGREGLHRLPPGSGTVTRLSRWTR